MARQQQETYDRLSASALGVGLLSVPTAFLPFGIAVAILAVVLGFIARRQGTERHHRSAQMAQLGILFGVVSIVLWLVVMGGFALFAGVYEG